MLYMLGGAGVKNFGDEIMVRDWLDFYRSANLINDIVVDGADAKFSKHFFGAAYSGIEFTDTFNSLKYKGPKMFWDSMRRGLNYYKNGGFHNYPSLSSWAVRMEDIKLMHLHGGGYLNTIWPQSAFLLGVAAATRYAFGCRLVATGIGLLPLTPPPDEYRKELDEVFAAFDFFETRDRHSNEYLQRYLKAPHNVFAGFDDTFLAAVEVSTQPEKGRSLHLSYFATADPSFETVLERVTETLGSHLDRVIFWHCSPSDDGKCWDILKARLPAAVSLPLSELVFRPLPVREGDFMVTSRFHPHMFAARAGAIGVYRKDGDYYDVKHQSIIDLGSSFRPLETLSSTSLRGPQEFNPIAGFDEQRVAMKRTVASRIVALYRS